MTWLTSSLADTTHAPEVCWDSYLFPDWVVRSAVLGHRIFPRLPWQPPWKFIRKPSMGNIGISGSFLFIWELRKTSGCYLRPLYSFSLFSSDIFEFSRNSFLNTFWDLSFSFLFTAPVVIWEYCWCDNKCGGWEVFYNPMIRCQSFCDLWPYCDLLCPSVAQESWRGMQWVFLFPHAEDWSWFNLGISLSLGWLDSCKVRLR